MYLKNLLQCYSAAQLLFFPVHYYYYYFFKINDIYAAFHPPRRAAQDKILARFLLGNFVL